MLHRTAHTNTARMSPLRSVSSAFIALIAHTRMLHGLESSAGAGALAADAPQQHAGSERLRRLQGHQSTQQHHYILQNRRSNSHDSRTLRERQVRGRCTCPPARARRLWGIALVKLLAPAPANVRHVCRCLSGMAGGASAAATELCLCALFGWVHVTSCARISSSG